MSEKEQIELLFKNTEKLADIFYNYGDKMCSEYPHDEIIEILKSTPEKYLAHLATNTASLVASMYKNKDNYNRDFTDLCMTLFAEIVMYF